MTKDNLKNEDYENRYYKLLDRLQLLKFRTEEIEKELEAVNELIMINEISAMYFKEHSRPAVSGSYFHTKSDTYCYDGKEWIREKGQNK